MPPPEQNPSSVSALLFHLGGEPFALPLAEHGAAMQQVGTFAGLPAWAISGPASEVRSEARRLARAGRLGLLLAHDMAGGRWNLAATIPPVRVVVTAAGELDALVLRRLARVARMAPLTPLAQAIACADALDLDAAGRRTFRALHQLLDRGIALLPGRVSRDDRHAWVLAQVTRLLFLRFVESEGWLDGNRHFLTEAFDRCLIARRDPTRHLLHPLFFGTLNRRCDDRSRFARSFGDIPFLNGGLFEPHAIERMHRLRLPVDYWRDAFAALVEHVDVTLDADVNDGRVTPELLGRVFEGVMHPEERKDTGAFFTPPALVTALLRESLACHLAPRLGRSESMLVRQLDDPDAELRRVLLDITVLDPAVGSGAFLVGALALLHGPGARDPARVRHLVTRRLFGVDRHPGAVRLCELRLWLEVLRAMRGRAPGRVPPLPNLDAQVRAGDALLDPLGSVVLDAGPARRIRINQRAILGMHGATKRTAIAESRRAERSAMLRALREAEAALDREIAGILGAARAPSLFGDRPRLSATARRDIQSRRKLRIRIRSDRRRLLRDADAAPFAIATAFAPVMSRRGGFDLVAGNPPWVRAERLATTTRDALAARYRWWRSGSGSGWKHLPDLAVAFVERGYSLLAPGGTLAFLVPAKLATAGYAGVCRQALSHRSTIHRVADLAGDPRAGFEATTYPFAIVASRRLPAPGHAVRLGLRADSPAQPQSQWEGSREWTTASPEAQRIAARLRTSHPQLAEAVRPQLGVKSGANAAFIDPPAELMQWTRPAVRGRDIRPFRASPSAHILWAADERGTPWSRVPPALAAYFEAHAATLGRRADQQRGPHWQLFRTLAATAPHRVVWRDVATELQAATLVGSAVPLNSCYVASLPNAVAAAALAAWFNATPVRALARLGAEPAAGGCARFAARTIAALPLPGAVLTHPLLVSLADAGATQDVQQELDACVASLLGLAPAECEILARVAAHRC